MADPMLGELTVRVNVVGHASPRWRSARNAKQAASLNQKLSESRARNVHGTVEQMLKGELRGVTFDVPWKGVGSQERFPTASEDDAAVDRSVVVSVDLTTKHKTYQLRPRGPRRIYAPSKVWTMKVLSLVGAVLGGATIYAKIAIKNPHTGKQIILSGPLLGGGIARNQKTLAPLDHNLARPIGSELAFTTSEAMDFDDWKKVTVRMGKAELSVGLKGTVQYLVFTELETSPKELRFVDKAGVGGLKAEAYIVSGVLTRQGDNPGDTLDLPAPADIVEVDVSNAHNSGLLLSFPTGKGGVTDLTAADRQRLQEFVSSRGRAIAAFMSTHKVTFARP